MKLAPAILVSALVMTAGCHDLDDRIEPVEVAIGVAGPMGHSAAVAMESMAAGAVACARVLEDCAGAYPCDGSVEIEVGEDCPLPLGEDAEGIVVVHGSWTAAGVAQLSADYTDISVGGRGLLVVEASSFSVTYDPAGVMATVVDFSDTSVELAGSQGLYVGATSWNVEIDPQGTPTNPRDDIFTIWGSDTTVQGTGTQTVDIDDVVLDPSCRRNPIGGTGDIVTVAPARVETLDVAFHADCDGRAEVDGTLVGFDVLN